MWNDRAITAGGLLFAVLTISGVALVLGGIAGGDTTNAEAARWLSESGKRTRAIAGMYLMCAGAICFIPFIAGTAARLRFAGAHESLVEVARFSGLAFVICQLVGSIAMAGAAYAVAADNEPTPIEPGAMRITTVGLALWLIPGMLCASAFVASVAWASLTSAAFPAWVGLSGMLCAAVLLGAIMFLPVFVLFLWTVSVAFVAVARRTDSLPLRTAPTRV